MAGTYDLKLKTG